MPARDPDNGMRPTQKDTPIVGHPPLFVNSVNTTDAGFLGESAHSGMATAKRPQKWTIKTSPSMSGSLLAPRELNINAPKTKAMVNRETCHLWYPYVS
jgi:hypothetical protein